MKYCPNCGNKIEQNQQFCNECGTKLIEKNEKTNSEHIKKVVNQQGNEKVNIKKQKKSKIWMVISSVVIIIILILALLFTGYLFYKNILLGNDSSDTSQSNNKSQGYTQIEINVLSDQFSEKFMNSDNTGGYQGFKLGMSKYEVKQNFGDSTDSIDMDIGDVEKFGDIGIYYGIDDTISSVYVLPERVSVDDFKQFHGEPTVETDTQLVYDDNPNNTFTILINIQGNKVLSIENTFQIDQTSLDNMKNSVSDNGKASQKFTQKAVNYAGGIGKILSTAFSASDYTEQDEYLFKAKYMVDNWDSALDELNNQVTNNDEEEILLQLEKLKDNRDEILDNIEEFSDSSNSKAWQNDQRYYETIKIELRMFENEYAE